MSTVSLRLPDSLHRHLKEVAEKDGVSINQFISLAIAEKLSALDTFDLIQQRASRGSREAFLNAMHQVPRGEVIKGDELPPR